jgi:hypothetical protein
MVRLVGDQSIHAHRSNTYHNRRDDRRQEFVKAEKPLVDFLWDAHGSS